MADINHANDEYKASRPSQILKSEERVKSFVNVLTEDFVNPFYPNFKRSRNEVTRMSNYLDSCNL